MPISLKHIQCRVIRIPFTVEFSHSSASRNETSSIYVEVSSEDGLKGYGEGCPREYVTGETLASALSFIKQYRDSLISEVVDLSSLRSWMVQHKHAIDKNPAAWCAMELALLDLLARYEDVAVERLLDVPLLSERFIYSAVLGDAGRKSFQAQLDRYIHAGFSRYKIKLSGDVQRDKDKITCLNESLGAEEKVRADANNLWQHAKDAARFIGLLEYNFEAIEEPLQANDYVAMSQFYHETGLPVILDESFTRIEQFEQLQQFEGQWIINLRVSKMGGLLRSIDIMKLAANAGIKVVVGAQVGETALLTRAALTVASLFLDMLHAQEGAFGTQLLTADLFEPSLMFSMDGVLNTAKYALRDQPGFGLEKRQDADQYLFESD